MDKQSELLPIKLFYSYALTDELLQQELEKHLGLLRQKGYIQEFHARHVIAGANWKQVIEEQLSGASLILLLISPDYLASDEYYHDELEKAIELSHSQSTQVIPILLRPVDGIGTLFIDIHPLPRNQKPVTSWENRDEAFSDIAHHVGETILRLHMGLNRHESLPLSFKQIAPSAQRLSLPLIFASISPSILKHQTQQVREVLWPQQKRRVVARVLMIVLTILVLIFPFTLFHPSLCPTVFCPSRPTRIPSTTPSVSSLYTFQNKDIQVSFSAFQSPFYVVSGTSAQHKLMPSYHDSSSVGAVSLTDSHSSNYSVVLHIQSLYHGTYSIIINAVSIIVSKVSPLPRPLSVWKTAEFAGYQENNYDVTYGGQEPGMEIRGENSLSHFNYVILSASDPSDHLTVRVHATVLVYFYFQIRLSYYRTDLSVPTTITLPGLFRVAFSNASNWQLSTW